MQSAIRIILFFGLIIGAGYTIFVNPQIIQSLFKDPKVSQAVDIAEEKVKGATSSLNLDTSPIFQSVREKLIEKQVLNSSANSASDSANNSIQQITNQITEQIKDIPKNQAKEIIQNTCQQLIDNLDKQ
jgi:K+-transporting ATPase c subunit